MPYVQRDEAGRICGVYEVEQYGYAEEWLDVAEIEYAPSAFRLYKPVFINRLTEMEAATMEAVLTSGGAKLRLVFNSVEYFVSDNRLFETLTAAAGQALGAERAAELFGRRIDFRRVA